MQTRTDYREWMKEALKERANHNPSYSLRAFARDLKLSPASVSLVLNGRKGLSKPTAERVARSLGLNTSEQEYFKALVLSKHARTESGRQMARMRVAHLSLQKEKHQIDLDQFQVISQWFHYGILQLTHLKGFRSEVAWIARQLDIPESDTREAIARLKRLNLILQHPDGRLTATRDILFTGGSAPSEAVRRFHRQLIEKALKAIHEQPMDRRELISSQFPIRRDQLPKIAAKLRALNEEIIQQHATGAGDAEAIYAVTFQMFQLNRETAE